MNTGIVHPKNVQSVWGTVAPMLEKATVTTRQRADSVDLLEQILKGQSILWICVEEDTKDIVAAFTTSFIEYPRYKALSVQYLGGSRMKEWLPPAMSVIKRFARDAGCETIEGYGREAWIKFLEPHGWSKAYVAFEVDLMENQVDIAAE